MTTTTTSTFDPSCLDHAISCGNVTPTKTGVRGALDVEVWVDGVGGDATVVPDPVNGGYAVYGNSPDMWLSGNLCRRPRDLLAQIGDAVCAHAALLA